MSKYEAVIGLETHIQLNTKSKIFCGCKADSWFDPPNTNICPVCTGLPGVLPALNQAALEKALVLALAMHMEEIRETSYFARKNYFYPDLPKGYQISQYDEPLARHGCLELPSEEGNPFRIRVAKLHLEEDAGKTVREGDRRLVDFNRCGVPLVEMVTEPDLRTAEQAADYLVRLRQLMRWLCVSEADLEKGQLRCDVNVSVRPAGSHELRTKTEIKNVNSIEAVRRALETEIERQIELVQSGGKVEPWTLDWDEDTDSLRKMRSKETEADYRYFREPDLLPIEVDPDWLSELREHLPELPLARRQRFIDQYGLPAYDAEILTEERTLSEYFERTVAADGLEPKTISNWLMNDVLRMLKDRNLTAGELKLSPEHLAELLALVEQGTINSSTAKELLEQVQETGISPSEIVEREGLAQISDERELEQLVRGILEANPEQVETFRQGKEAVLGWFVGQVMRQTQGKANPQLARQLFEELLDEDPQQ